MVRARDVSPLKGTPNLTTPPIRSARPIPLRWNNPPKCEKINVLPLLVGANLLARRQILSFPGIGNFRDREMGH